MWRERTACGWCGGGKEGRAWQIGSWGKKRGGCFYGPGGERPFQGCLVSNRDTRDSPHHTRRQQATAQGRGRENLFAALRIIKLPKLPVSMFQLFWKQLVTPGYHAVFSRPTLDAPFHLCQRSERCGSITHIPTPKRLQWKQMATQKTSAAPIAARGELHLHRFGRPA